MRRRPIELPSGVQVTHLGALLLLLQAAALELFAIREALEPHAEPETHLVQDLLISFSDLRPKFLVLSISCSERCTSSPMNLMSAFCRQLAERTESSSSSTGRNRFSLILPSIVSSSGSAISVSSSKLMKIASWSCRMRAANASASSGSHAAVGPDLEHQTIVVGALSDARVGDVEVDLEDRREDRVERHGADRIALFLVVLGRRRSRDRASRPAPSRAAPSFDERRDVLLGIEDLDARAGLTMSAAVTLRSPLTESRTVSSGTVEQLDPHFLQVEDDVGHVLA